MGDVVKSEDCFTKRFKSKTLGSRASSWAGSLGRDIPESRINGAKNRPGISLRVHSALYPRKKETEQQQRSGVEGSGKTKEWAKATKVKMTKKTI